jgi:D-beta-D-heptose 7-phosphate kinase/D-beta-D-heptose 1-phosphate adenosyltransferase
MENQRLNDIINNFSGKKIAVLGDLMLDVYIWGKASRISPEAPVPIVRVKEKSHCLGGAANVMLNVVTLGGRVNAFGVVGNDQNGKSISKLLELHSINDSSVFVDEKRKTTEKQRVLAGSQQLLRIDFEDVDPISQELKKKIIDNLLSLIEKKEIDAIIFEDYAKGSIDREMLEIAISKARENNIPTALDPHAKQLLEVKGLTLLKPNRSEAFALAGQYCQDPMRPAEEDKGLLKAAEKIMQDWEPENLLISLGPQGLALFEKSGGFHIIPTQAKKVYDVSGAGDTVMSAFVLSLLGGASGKEAATISNHAAGIVVGKLGTATVTTDELKDSFNAPV